MGAKEYKVVWALETVAQKFGWHRTERRLEPNRIVITFEKDFEPEPGIGKEDSA